MPSRVAGPASSSGRSQGVRLLKPLAVDGAAVLPLRKPLGAKARGSRQWSVRLLAPLRALVWPWEWLGSPDTTQNAKTPIPSALGFGQVALAGHEGHLEPR